MYTNSVATIRRDINVFLEQAQGIEPHFIGQKLMPVLPVEEKAAQYPRMKIAEGGLMRRDVTKRNATGTYNEITRKHSWDNYVCEDRGLKERVDDDKASDMSKYFDLEVQTAKLVRRSMLIDFEVSVKNQIFNESTFTLEEAKEDYTEANLATVDVPYDINLALENLQLRGVQPNTIVLSQKLWNYVRRSKLLQDYIFGSQDTTKRKLIKRADLATTFGEEMGVDNINVVVAAAAYDSSNRAKDTPTLTPIWPASHIWIGNVASGDFANGGVGRTLVWKKAVRGGAGLFLTETWRDEDRRGDMLRVRSYSIEKVIDESAGQLIKTNFA